MNFPPSPGENHIPRHFTKKEIAQPAEEENIIYMEPLKQEDDGKQNKSSS